ncbi:MAG: phage baseplate assembly protein V, partial [Deltaproteobacteria bacterium]|nr:phage baseplate assembly protein V [Deltaproteobacteria bacterium]
MVSDLASLLFQQIRQAEDESDRVYEVVIGIVTDNHDPQKLGRVKVKLPTLSRDDSTWWAPIAMPGAGNQRGWFFLPEIDDEVLIGFEHGDIARPIVLGALWNGKDQPPLANPDGDNAQRAVVSRGGSRILFDDKDDQIVIEDGGGVGRITLDAKHNKIVVEALIGDACVHCKDDLVIQAKEIEMVAKATLAITSTSGNVKGNANAITIKGTAMLRVQGAQIGINDNGAKALDGSVVAQPADGEPVHAPPPLPPPPPPGAPG